MSKNERTLQVKKKNSAKGQMTEKKKKKENLNKIKYNYRLEGLSSIAERSVGFAL